MFIEFGCNPQIGRVILNFVVFYLTSTKVYRHSGNLVNATSPIILKLYRFFVMV